MPLYSYRCADCYTVFDVVHGFDDDAPACECGGAAVRVFAPVRVEFKGSGFYSTEGRETGK